MLEILQWFDDRDRFVGIIVFMMIAAMAIAHVVGAFKRGDD